MDWVSISSAATAVGTLVLAAATFVAVRSGNRSARIAERALLSTMRPLLMPSHMEDASQKVGFVDNHWVYVPGGQGTAEATEEAVYLTISVRNAGTGLAVLEGWRLSPRMTTEPHANLDDFYHLTRDLYIPAGEVGFWQGAFRDTTSDEFAAARTEVDHRDPISIEILYGDEEGGQRVITRFNLAPRQDGGYLATVARHWHLDRPGPRDGQVTS
jgi:hypothetical protein